MDMHGDEHWTAIARYLAGESPPEEQAYVRKWLAEDPRNQLMLDTLGKAQASVAVAPPKDLDVEAALKRVHERIDAPVVRPLSPKPEEPRFKLHPALAAAAILTLIVVGGLVNRRFGPVEGETYSATTRPDSVVLSDGTGVLLSAGSTISTYEGFGRSARLVKLEGEALFDVEPGRVNFNVQVRSGLVSDISTRFSVRNDAGTPVRVVVTEGSVWVQHAGQRDTLRAGQRATLRDGRIVTDSATADDLAWTRSRLVYNNAPLDVVRADLRRWYGIHLVADSAFANRHLTATFQGDPVPRVLDVIALALGARIERRGDSAFVRAR